MPPAVVRSYQGECGVCFHGWVLIRDRPETYDRPLTDPEWQALHPQQQEWLRNQFPDGILRAMPLAVVRDRVAICLCALGWRLRSKLTVRECVSVDKVLTELEIHALWPSGPPKGHLNGDRLAMAGLLPATWTWTLESFGKTFKDQEAKRFLKRAVEWVEIQPTQRTDVILFGSNGTGKTGLAIGMLMATLERGEVGRFIEAKALFSEWTDTFREGSTRSEADFVAKMTAYAVLVIDELAAGTTEFKESSLQMLLDRRSQSQRQTIITMNVSSKGADNRRLTPADMLVHVYERLGPALTDRMRERAQFWPLLGSSRRRAVQTTLPDLPSL